MSVILEALLDDERRAECRANDVAMAMDRPIIASHHPPCAAHQQHASHRQASEQGQALRAAHAPVLLGQLWLDRRSGKNAARTARHHAVPSRSEHSDATQVATDEHW